MKIWEGLDPLKDHKPNQNEVYLILLKKKEQLYHHEVVSKK
jgi:hypothetical protein